MNTAVNDRIANLVEELAQKTRTTLELEEQVGELRSVCIFSSTSVTHLTLIPKIKSDNM